MPQVPKYGAIPLLYVVEESRGHAWRSLGTGYLDQGEALAELEAQVSSYARRVVQVVAVRLPPDSEAAEIRADVSASLVQGIREGRAATVADFPRPRGVTP